MRELTGCTHRLVLHLFPPSSDSECMNSTGVVAGIDIGGTNTEIGIVEANGTCRVRATLPTGQYDQVEEFVQDLHNHITSLLASEPSWQLHAIGIGAPNGNYYRGTIEHAPNLRWRGVIPLAQLLHLRMNIPVVLTNDANAAALGEMMYGGAGGMKHFIVITLGTGVGSGIVCEGRLVYGHSGFAGEIGHTIVDPEGRTCGCGRRGCLETYASASGIVRTMRELLEANRSESVLRRISSQELTAAEIADAARNGDPLAREAFERTGRVLGLKLADAVAHTSPEAIFLFGGLARAGEILMEPTQRWFNTYLLNVFQGTVQLLPSSLPDNAGILGAAALGWQELSRRNL